MDGSLTGSSVHGILQARMLEWVAMPSPKGSSHESQQERANMAYSSVQLRRLVVSDSLRPHEPQWPHEPQHALSITNSQSPPKPMSIVSVMPSNHLILRHPLLLLPSIIPSTRGFSNESALRIRWPKYWSFSFNISPSNEHPGLISFRTDWLDILASKGSSTVFSNTTVQKHQFFGAQLSL